ncbi:MAG: CDP-diacylglycerol--serine O-phosphatidyltransferase [Ignavibacteriaceae bacterium]|nr:CDP-diacylglycerol--serine O-phosphatidyltransferase [Ignavibacteriaceae bacterium]
MNRLRITPSVIPNMFTAMNMFCGFLSLINTASGEYIYACWLIIIAAMFDILDGTMARLTKSSSALGVQLDSLSDLVSFGVAPAFLIYKTHLISYDAVGILISSLLMIAGGFRLARFNVQLVGFNKSFFTGLPIPSSAITISAFIIAFYTKGVGFNPAVVNYIIPLVIVLSYLMVSRVKYDTIPKFSKQELKEKPYLMLIPVILMLLFIFVPLKRILFLIFVLIILFGIFRHVYNLFSNNLTKK